MHNLSHPRRFGAALLSLLLMLMMAACADETETTDLDAGPVPDTTLGDPAAMNENSIVDLLASDSRFSTLTTALDSAGLTTTLQGAGPFTLFAPTNNAFSQFGGQANQLLLPENRDQLRNILMYHVTDRKLGQQDLAGLTSVETLEGSTLDVQADGDQVLIGGSTLTEATIEAGNGVVHVIDTVLQPGAASGM